MTDDKVKNHQKGLQQTLKIYELACINLSYLEKAKKIADGEFGDDEHTKNLYKRLSANYEDSKKYVELLRQKIIDIELLLKKDQ
jgi:hypothetical protein